MSSSISSFPKKFFPEFTLCAFRTILLLAACLKILSKCIVGICYESIKSSNTLPGPTDANWSTSPTNTNFVP